LANYRERLHRERLIQLDDVDIVELYSSERQRFRNGHGWPDPHDFRWHAASGKTDISGHWSQSEPASLALRNHQGRGSAIAGLRSCPRRHSSGCMKHRLQLGKRIEACIRAWALVAGE